MLFFELLHQFLGKIDPVGAPFPYMDDAKHIKNLADPTEGQDAATKAYVDSHASSPDGGVGDAKAFFSAQGLLPANKIVEASFIAPPPDFQNLGASVLTQRMSLNKITNVGNVDHKYNFGWNLGAERTKVLVIFGLMRSFINRAGLFVADALPAAVDLPAGTYVGQGVDSTEMALSKTAGGSVFVDLLAESDVIPEDFTTSHDMGLAFYYQVGAPNLLKLFIRIGSEVWWPVLEVSDASFGTMKYAGIWGVVAGQPNIWWSGCPILVYAE